MAIDSWQSPQWTAWTLGRLCALLRDAGGLLQASQLGDWLFAEDPDHREVLKAWGGLQKFCAAYPERLDWLPDGGSGVVRLRPMVMEGKGEGKGKAGGKGGKGGKSQGKGDGKDSAKGKGKNNGKDNGKGAIKGAGKATGDAEVDGKGKKEGKGKGKAAGKSEGKSDGKGWVPKGAGPKGAVLAAASAKADNQKARIFRLAAAFAGEVPDLDLPRLVTKEEIRQHWTLFCDRMGETTGGFARVFYALVMWGVLVRAGARFAVRDRTTHNFKKRAPTDSMGALEGEMPSFLGTQFENPLPVSPLPMEFVRLKEQDVYSMQRAVQRVLTRTKQLSPKAISSENYANYFHSILFTEELQMLYDISLYDLELHDPLSYARGFHKIFVPGLAEKRPSILVGDAVLITCKAGRFRGFVHRVLLDSIEVSFHPSFPNKLPMSVHFSFTRTPLMAMHRAIAEFAASAGDLLSTVPIQRPASPRPHPLLNAEQREFLDALALPSEPAPRSGRRAGKAGATGATLPHLLWGPPGTGKTTTLVHTIAAVLRDQTKSQVLVCAPSNPAADLLCERLADLGVAKTSMLRLVALMRDPRQVPEKVRAFTRTKDGRFVVPSLDELKAYRVVVATCSAAAYLRSRLPEREPAWFSHVFVDEAAQALEPEALIPLTLRAPGGRLVLAGDFKQLGPVIRSPVALQFGLGVSLMERIKDSIGIGHSRVFTLLDTYRAHPSILRLYNKTVYGDVLRCCSPIASRDMEQWPECPRDEKGAHPIIFHNVVGEESRTQDSPSWMNKDEAQIVKQYLMRLLTHDGVKAQDIGIISPYHKQCQQLRLIAMGEGLDIEVGTTELFQGREKRIIIISTVRSRQEAEISSDFRFALGFLGNFKRTNVALSRARSLLIVVGNMSLLSRDATWHNTIRLVQTMGCLRGNKFELRAPAFGENSEWVGSSTALVAGDQPADGVVDRPWRDPL